MTMPSSVTGPDRRPGTEARRPSGRPDEGGADFGSALSAEMGRPDKDERKEPGRTGDRTAAERAAAERAVVSRASTERAAAARASAERTADRAAAERTAAAREATQRAATARVAGRDTKRPPLREPADRATTGRDERQARKPATPPPTVRPTAPTRPGQRGAEVRADQPGPEPSRPAGTETAEVTVAEETTARARPMTGAAVEPDRKETAGEETAPAVPGAVVGAMAMVAPIPAEVTVAAAPDAPDAGGPAPVAAAAAQPGAAPASAATNLAAPPAGTAPVTPPVSAMPAQPATVPPAPAAGGEVAQPVAPATATGTGTAGATQLTTAGQPAAAPAPTSSPQTAAGGAPVPAPPIAPEAAAVLRPESLRAAEATGVAVAPAAQEAATASTMPTADATAGTAPAADTAPPAGPGQGSAGQDPAGQGSAGQSSAGQGGQAGQGDTTGAGFPTVPPQPAGAEAAGAPVPTAGLPGMAGPQAAAPAAPIAEAPAAAPPAPSAPAPPAAQLATRIVPLKLDADGVHRLTVHLHPVDLGPVQVVAEIRNGDITVQLSGATEAGAEALRSSLDELRQELKDAGFNNCSLDLRQGNAQQQARQQFADALGRRSDGGSRNGPDADAEPAPVTTRRVDPGAGRIDIQA